MPCSSSGTGRCSSCSSLRRRRSSSCSPPITVAIAGIGVYSIVTTLLWGRLLFGVPFHVLHPALFVVSIPAAVLSIGMLGLVLASTLVLYREASAFSQMLEYPVWMITGMLIPLSLLPGWIHPLSWTLAPTWGMRAVRRAALGGPVGRRFSCACS